MNYQQFKKPIGSNFFRAYLALFLFCVNVDCGFANDDSLFLQLVRNGDMAKTEKLLNSRFVDLETRDKRGDTALLIAARTNQLKMFDLLVQYGANINVIARNRRDILNLSVRISNPELAKHAIKAGINTQTFTPTYQGSALIFASHKGEVEIVKALIDAGAPVNRVNNLGWTAMLEAVILGDGSRAYIDIVKRLLAAGADKTIADKDGKTPLDHARGKGYKEISQLLEASSKGL